MDTFELLPSLAAGELSETSAPELVAAVFRSRASGTLWLETDGAAEIRIFFRAGDMCGSANFTGFKTLAHVLLENDWVNALDIDSSRTEAEAGKKRHGEVLVQKGMLTPEQLREALGLQHRANLATLLGLTQGKYDWRGWEPPPPWAREVVVDPVGCLVDALESDKHAVRRKRVIDWLGNNAARLSLDWPELQGRVLLGNLERRAAALLALPRKLDEFAQASRLPRLRAEALLAALMLCGGAEPQPRSFAPPPEEPAPAPVNTQENTPIEGEAILEPLPEPEPELLPEPELQPEHSAPELEPLSSDAELQPIAPEHEELFPAPPPAQVAERDAIARLDSLSLDDVPASPDTGEEDPLELSRTGKLKPALGGVAATPLREELTLESQPVDVAPRAEQAAADERGNDLRKKMMARGLRNLGAGPSRQEQELELAEEPAPPSQGGTPFDAQELEGEDARFAEDVRARARAMPQQNSYARLNVSPSAPQEAIKTAYLNLAKKFHPDRASAAVQQLLREELQTVFTGLKDAWDALSTAQLRAAYDAQLKAAPKGGRKEEAILALKMGDALLKKRDFEGAINKLRRSVDLDPSGDALAALAWGLVCDPKASPQQKEEAASLINRALRASGATARTYYVAGVLWRTKDPDSAVDAFRKTLELDPHHSDAALELRLIEQRRGKEKKTGGGVLSGLLFGKRKS